jgi:hypothetical protein
VGAEAENYQPWFYLVIVILSVEGALAPVVVHPLPLLVQENIGLLQSWGAWEGLRRGGEFSGIYFVPVFGILLAPALGVMTAVAFIFGAAASLGYLLMGLEGSPRVLLRSICLQVALLLGLFFALDLFEVAIRIVTTDITRPEAAQPKAEILSWLTGQTDVFTLMARRFAWLLSVFFISVVMVLWKAHEQQLKAKQVLGNFPEEMPIQIGEKLSVAESPRAEIPYSFVETDQRFQQDSYLIKYRFLSNPLYKDFGIYGSDYSTLIFVARMNSLSLLARVITVCTADKKRSETLLISGRRFVRFPNIFTLTYCPTNKMVGTFTKTSTGWAIMDDFRRQIGALKFEEATAGSMKCQVLMGSLQVCSFIFQHVVRPIITISFPDDSAGIFDRKLAIGLALVLGFQSVAFNRPYADSSSQSY